jgi:NADH dehydrogenase
MLSFIKKFFGAKPTVNPCSDVPYKVEGTEHFPFPKAVAEEKKPAVKKPAAKQPAAKKPRAPRTPKA